MLCGGWEESMGAPYGDGLHTSLLYQHWSCAGSKLQCAEQEVPGLSFFRSDWTGCGGGGGGESPRYWSVCWCQMWAVIKHTCCPQYSHCFVKYLLHRDIQHGGWHHNHFAQHSHHCKIRDYQALEGMALQLLCDGWVRSEKWRRSLFVLFRSSRGLRGVWDSDTVSLLWAVTTHHTLHHLHNNQRNKRIMGSSGGSGHLSVLQIRLLWWKQFQSLDLRLGIIQINIFIFYIFCLFVCWMKKNFELRIKE